MKTPSFIYSLTWEGTDLIYVGCTKNPKSRAASHKYGKQSPGIAAAIEAHGDPTFTILEIVSGEINPHPRECHWIIKLKSQVKYPGGLNKNLTGLAIEIEAPPVIMTGAEIEQARKDLVETELLPPLFAEKPMSDGLAATAVTGPQFPALKDIIRAQLQAQKPTATTADSFDFEREKIARRRWLAEALLAAMPSKQ